LEVNADLPAPDALPIGKDALVFTQETEKRTISAFSKNRTLNHPSSGLVCILAELCIIIWPFRGLKTNVAGFEVLLPWCC